MSNAPRVKTAQKKTQQDKTLQLKTDEGQVKKKVSLLNSSDSNVVKLLFLGEYYNLHTRQMSPVTARFVENEAQKIMDWAVLEDSLRIVDYTDSQGYAPQVYYTWIKRFPAMQLAHEFALRRIGSKREHGALTRKYSEKVVGWTLGSYDQVFRDEMLAIARMKEEFSQNADIKVVVEHIPFQDSVEQLYSSNDQDEEEEEKPTPAQVAMRVRRNTRLKMKSGAGDYIAASTLKKEKKRLEEKYE